MVFTAAVFHLLEALGMAVLYASASFNMELMSSTKAVSQVEMSLLNAFAPSNMEAMVSTLAVFQVEMSLSNTFAPSNMEAMVFTAAVFHLLEALGRAVLYASAPFNMELMSSTKAVSQEEMSLLKIFAPS